MWTAMAGPKPMSDDEKLFFVKLGERISALRQAAGLTQAQLATELAVSQQTINSFERGRRRVPVSALPALGRALGVSIEELLDATKQKAGAKRGPPSKLERQLEEIRQLPRAKQKFVIDMLDAVLAQAHRSQSA